LWLESLAQKQGAKAEELITNPDERKEVAPDWVAQVGQEPVKSAEPVIPVETPPVPVEAQSDESLAWLQGLAAEEPVAAEQPVETPPVPTEAQGEQSMAWLEGLAAEEPVVAEQPAEESPVEQQPAEQDWFKEMDTAAAGAAAGVAADEGLDWLNNLGKPAEETPAPLDQPEQPVAEQPVPGPQEVEPTAAVGSETSQWLTSLEKGDAPEQPEVLPWEQETPMAEAAHPETVPEIQPQAAEEITPEVAGITDWLKNLEVQEQASTAAVQPDTVSEELPDWLKDTSVDEQPLVPEPVSGWTAADETPSQPPAEVEMPASSLPYEEMGTPAPIETAPVVSEEQTPEPEPVAKTAPMQPSPLRQTGILGGDKDALAVQRARDLLGRGGLDMAMSEYTKLIKRAKMLEEVIHDLQEAVYSHPVDMIVWQTLGDAYMRSNRLQDALDAYSRAEELLR
jgi:hypothetical protein